MTDSPAESDRRSLVPLKFKILLYIAAWLLAFLATDPDFGLWAVTWMFPLGLAEFVDHRSGVGGGWGIFSGCIGVYLVHGFFYFRSRRRAVTWLLYGVLVILLVCNVQGCRAMIHAH